MAATGYGQGGDISRVAKTGDVMTGPLVLTGNPAMTASAGAGTGDVWTSDAQGNGSWKAPAGAGGALLAANNLSDLTSAGSARTNLGLGSASVLAASAFAQTANNLSDLTSAAGARTNLGLGAAAVQPLSAFLQPSNNLSDVGSAATARTNLGLGTAALLASSAVAQTASNLSDLASAGSARSNLGLGSAALSATSAFLQPGNNLSDVSSAATARTNLGLGSAALLSSASLLLTANNLSDLSSAGAARTNLGLGSAAVSASSAFLQPGNNLSDLTSAGTSRTNLGLGSAALLSSAAVAQTVNNLSDLASAGTARTNLGLGAAATQALSAFLQPVNNLADVSSTATARTNLGLTALATAALPLSIANGGTSSSAAQTAINNLVGSTSAGQYLRGNGSNAVMSLLLTADVPVSSVENYWLPGDHGMIAWAFDPAAAGGNSLPGTGVIQLIGMELRVGKTITNLLLNVTTPGSALTSSQNYAALFSSNGTMLASTGDQSTVWNSAGLKTMALTSAQAVAAGMYWVGFVTNGVTAPQFARGTAVGGASTMLNAGLAASAARYATNGAGQTSLASIAPASNALGAMSWWAGMN